MDILSLLSEVDSLLQKGKFVDAAKKFFADDVITVNEFNHPINGKDAKIASLNDMQSHIKKVHSVKLLNQTSKGNTSFSEFNYHFEYENGAQNSYGEIIKREWDKDGKIVSEKYYKGAIDPEKKVETKKAPSVAAKATVTKKETPVKKTEAKPEAVKVELKKSPSKKK